MNHDLEKDILERQKNCWEIERRGWGWVEKIGFGFRRKK